MFSIKTIKKLSIILLLLLFFFPSKAYAAGTMRKTGNTLVIRQYVSDDNGASYYLAQQSSIQLQQNTAITDRDTFVSARRVVGVASYSNGGANPWFAPYVIFTNTNNTYTLTNSQLGEGSSPKYGYVRFPVSFSNTGYTWITTKYYTLLDNRTIGYWESGGSAPLPQLMGVNSNISYFRTNLSVGGLASYLNPYGSNQIYNNTTCYQDIHWIRNSYTLYYNGNGGSVSESSRNILYRANYSFPSVSRTGYTFAGWYTAASGGSQVTGNNTMDAGNTTVYAHWTVNNYTLTANANGGSIPSTSGWSGSGNTATKSVTYGTGYGTLPTPTRTDYKFLGWFTAASGGSQVSASTTMGAGNTTIYAHWDRNKFTIQYNSNGGDGTVANQVVNTNENVTLKANSYNKAHGWTFVGWSRKPHVMNKEFSASQTINALSGTRDDTVTLYAIWRRTNTGFIQRPMFDTKMFFKTVSIVGQAGKHYNVHDIDSRMAHIDNPNGTNNDGSSGPGYFTVK